MRLKVNKIFVVFNILDMLQFIVKLYLYKN
jgi:hypothetical protein